MDGCGKPQPKTKRSLCRRSALRYSGLLQLILSGALSHKNPVQKISPSFSSAFTSSTLRHEQRKCLRVTGTVRENTRGERQSSHCMNQLHSWRELDEKLEGSFFLTSTRQKSILRGSEIFGYDEKEYPERMLQRAAGWCKAVQGVRGKILSELSG